MLSLRILTVLLVPLALALLATTVAAQVDIPKLDVSRFVERDRIIVVINSASTTTLASATPTTSPFVCDNCAGYNLLIQTCLASITISASTTVNQIQLPLLQCLCKESGFYQAFGDCHGCDGQVPKSQVSFNQQCQAIVAGKVTISLDSSYNIPVKSYTAGVTTTRPVLSKDPAVTSYIVNQVTLPNTINGTFIGATATIPLDGVTTGSTGPTGPTVSLGSTGVNMVTPRGGVVLLAAAVVVALAW